MMELFKAEMPDKSLFQAYSWIVEKPVAILQIAHGMMDHAGRYDHFSKWMNEHNVTVYASDHIGHGLTAADKSELGHFAGKDDWNRSVEMLHILNNKICSLYPGIPVFLLGHSMGSVMAQTYMIKYGREASGYILSGAVRQPESVATFGHSLASILSFFNGPADRSALLHYLVFGQFNNKFKPNRTSCDWLSTDVKIVDEYNNSPLCGFKCSNRFYQNFFNGFKFIAHRSNLGKIPAGTKVYIMAGRMDPAGRFGKDPKKINFLLSKYAKANVLMKLYSEDRHEIMNEKNREQVYEDLLKWILERK
jgi:alpha-beta hydrolase superfamily lysophospholipase